MGSLDGEMLPVGLAFGKESVTLVEKGGRVHQPYKGFGPTGR